MGDVIAELKEENLRAKKVSLTSNLFVKFLLL